MSSIEKKTRNCQSCIGRQTNVFCDLPPEALQILNESKVVNHFKRSQYVFYAGNSPSGLYCVGSGVVRLESVGSNGNTHILQVVKAGGILGYRSLFADDQYEAAAVVHEDAELCYVPKAALTELMNKYPSIGMKFLASLSKELKVSEGRMCGLTDKNAAERIAEALLFLKVQHAEQTWTRKEIAEWAGTTPETVMRTLADFEAEGIVELVGRRINIIKNDRLMNHANLNF